MASRKPDWLPKRETAPRPSGRGAVRRTAPFLSVVGPEVVLLERNRLSRHLAERVLGRAVVGGRRVDRSLGLLRGLDAQAAIALHAGPGRDQLADDHVLREADQR